MAAMHGRTENATVRRESHLVLLLLLKCEHRQARAFMPALMHGQTVNAQEECPGKFAVCQPGLCDSVSCEVVTLTADLGFGVDRRYPRTRAWAILF